jgi:hypothetical protein
MVVRTEQDELIARYIAPDPSFGTPDRAWLVDSSHSVKTIILWLKYAGWDVEGAERRDDLPVDAVRAALAYW